MVRNFIQQQTKSNLRFLAQGLLQGRSKLIEVNRGIRYKLLSRDKNEIDTMFIDRRGSTANGNTLVIACEGNAGFYEIGVMGTPVEAGYSTLGWNHPGFGGSTVRLHFFTIICLYCHYAKIINRSIRYDFVGANLYFQI